MKLTAIVALPLSCHHESEGKIIPQITSNENLRQSPKQWSAYFHKRVIYVHSGEYTKVFQTGAPLVAYVCLTKHRRETLQRLAMGVLKTLGKEKLAGNLRFASVDRERVYELGLFEKGTAIFYRPDAPETPVPLFPS